MLSCILSSACHKLLPSAGLGAVTAMQDAVVLANCLYEMKGLELSDISATLDQFKNERYVKVKAQYEASKTNARLIYGQVSYMPHFTKRCYYVSLFFLLLSVFAIVLLHRFFSFFLFFVWLSLIVIL